MKRLELKTKCYISKDMAEYMAVLFPDNNGEKDPYLPQPDISEMDPPRYSLGRLSIDPNDILFYSEVFSLHEVHYNPNNPKLDSVSITLRNGDEFTLAHTYDEFEEKLRNFFENI